MDRGTKCLNLILASIVLIWGAHYTVGKWGMEGFNPVTYNALRFVFSTPLLFILLYFIEGDVRIEIRDCLELAFIGLVGIAIYQTLFMATVKYASATNAALLIAISPVFTAVFSSLAGHERLGGRGYLGGGLAFLGVSMVLLFGTNKFALGPTAWMGDCLGIVASGIWGFYPVMSRRMLRKYSAIKTLAYAAMFGSVFLSIAAIPYLNSISWFSIASKSWFALFYSIGPATVYGLVAWYYCISKLGANNVMAYMYIIPAMAAVTAFILLGEQIYIVQMLGAVLILVGIQLITKERRTLNIH